MNAVLRALNAKTLDPSRETTDEAPNQGQSDPSAFGGGSGAGVVPMQCFERIIVGRGSSVPRNEGITFQRFCL